MRLKGVGQPRPPRLTVVQLDEDGNLQPVEQQLQNVAPSNINTAVFYLQRQWPEFGNPPPWK